MSRSFLATSALSQAGVPGPGVVGDDAHLAVALLSPQDKTVADSRAGEEEQPLLALGRPSIGVDHRFFPFSASTASSFQDWPSVELGVALAPGPAAR